MPDTKKKDVATKDEPKLPDLAPPQDPKGGKTSTTLDDELRTSVRPADRGGWDGNHNATVARRRTR
jgi:hypothetical protein